MQGSRRQQQLLNQPCLVVSRLMSSTASCWERKGRGKVTHALLDSSCRIASLTQVPTQLVSLPNQS
jgi:hypothetical protein